MMKKTIGLVAVLASAVLTPAGGADQAAPNWKAGAAAVVITPDGPTWMAGYASRDKPSEGKFQDLFAKALAVQDSHGTRLVIVTLDLIGIPRALREELENEIREKYQLPPAGLLINASHTHSGPVVRAEKSAIYHLTPEQGEQVTKYVAGLREKLVALVGEALNDLGPARLGYSRARAGFAMNRRLPTEKGYRNSPYPDGPVDHDVPVLRVERPDGTLRAVLFGYACHSTTLGLYEFCGDYGGYAQQYLQEIYPDAVAMFMAGCGGDQNPYPRGTLERAQQHGRTLATAVEAAMLPEPVPLPGPLGVALEPVALEFTSMPSREELTELAGSSNRFAERRGTLLLEELDEKGKLRDSYPYLVQVVQFGPDLTLVALGGEAVVDYSLRLKRELAGRAVWVAGYSNDVFAYVPSKRVLAEGGYEADGAVLYTTLPGPFAPSLEDRIVGKVHELTEKLLEELPGVDE
ncbi:MAG: neutral/alkaline non-lysosomal ceramidase N-terminal domain-containing protein [Patescibacteria group bacterium]|nr:neutral/alkaline non-lysosomal ceramidase N-terminal domain-containing protein [Patescibacteria group bacterium]